MWQPIRLAFQAAAQSFAGRAAYNLLSWSNQLFCLRSGRPKLIELSTFRPEASGLSLLEDLHQAGFTNPILYGGALRDDYFRNCLGINVPTNDYDVRAGVDRKRVLGDATTYDAIGSNLIKYVQRSFPGCLIRGALINLELRDIPLMGNIIFSYKGKTIDLMFDPESAALPLRERMWAESSLNMIAMDMNGSVIADANFAAHANNLIYHPYKPISSEKDLFHFRKLAQKIPGLNLAAGRMSSRVRPANNRLDHPKM